MEAADPLAALQAKLDALSDSELQAALDAGPDALWRIRIQSTLRRRGIVTDPVAIALHKGETAAEVAARLGVTAATIRRRHAAACGSHTDCEHVAPTPQPKPSKPKRRLRAVDNEPDDDTEPTYWETFPAWDDYPDPEPPLLCRDDGHPIIPGEGHTEIMGAWGSAKSWLAQKATTAALRAWRPVVYLRLEGHQKGLHHRLRMLGLTDDVIRDPERFRSVTIDYLFEHRRWSKQFLCPRGVLIVDTVSRAGGSTNDADKAEEWLADNVDDFTKGGCLVITVDHVAKHFADDLVAMSSRGSSAKTSASDFAIHLIGHRKHNKRPVSTCWGPNHDGHVNLYIGKEDRHGQIDADGKHGALARVRGYHDPATGGFRLDIDPPTPEDDKTEGPTPADMVLTALDILTTTDGLNYGDLCRLLRVEGLAKNKAEGAIANAITLGYIDTTKKGKATIHTLSFEGIQHHANHHDTPTDIS